MTGPRGAVSRHAAPSGACLSRRDLAIDMPLLTELSASAFGLPLPGLIRLLPRL